jgi:hypothetical protein
MTPHQAPPSTLSYTSLHLVDPSGSPAKRYQWESYFRQMVLFIAEKTADDYGLDKATLTTKGVRGPQQTSDARRMCYCLCLTYLKPLFSRSPAGRVVFSENALSKMLGKDHSSGLHYKRSHADLYQTSAEYRERFDRLCEKITLFATPESNDFAVIRMRTLRGRMREIEAEIQEIAQGLEKGGKRYDHEKDAIVPISKAEILNQ